MRGVLLLLSCKEAAVGKTPAFLQLTRGRVLLLLVICMCCFVAGGEWGGGGATLGLQDTSGVRCHAGTGRAALLVCVMVLQ